MRQNLAFVILFLLGLCLLCWTRSPYNWIGAALVVGPLAVLFVSGSAAYAPFRVCSSSLRSSSITARIFIEIVCILLIFSLASAMMSPCLGGDRPVSSDHNVHYSRAWFLNQRISGGNYPLGWNNNWFAGFPLGYFYPILADLSVVALYRAGLGSLSFDFAYAFTFAFSFFLHGFAVYWLARKAFGRAVGLIAALFVLTDSGGQFEAGWRWSVFMGVWPANLANTFSLLAVSQIEDLLFGTGRKSIALFGLFLGFSLLAHPIQIGNYSLLLPLIALLTFIFSDRKSIMASLSRLLLGCLVGGLIASFWFLPQLTVTEFAEKDGFLWHSFAEIGLKLESAALMQNMWVYPAAFGALGSLILLFSRSFLPTLIGFIPFCYIFVASRSFSEALSLREIVSFFEYIHFTRFVTFLKPYWFIAGAAAICGAANWLLFQAHARPSLGLSPKRFIEKRPAAIFIRFALIGILLSPIFFPFVTTFVTKQVSRTIQVESARSSASAIPKIVEWLAEQRAKDPRFFRVALDRSIGSQQFLLDLPTKSPVPLLRCTETAAVHYRFQMTSSHPELLRILSVRYIISKRELFPPNFVPAGQIEAYRLYEFTQYSPDVFQFIEGTASGELLKFSDEEIIIRVRAETRGRLRLAVSDFPRWHAFRNKREIPIFTTQIPNHPKTGFITVRLRPGEHVYRFVFMRAWPEWVGLALSVCGLSIVLVLLAVRPTR